MRNNMKYCEKCKTENPLHANFCRSCGMEFEKNEVKKNSFDKGSCKSEDNSILKSLRPANSGDCDFLSVKFIWGLLYLGFFALLIPAFFVFLFIEIFMGDGYLVLPVFLILFIIYMVTMIIYCVRQKNKFKNNVDFIEDGDGIVRIAMRNQMGLYNSNRDVVLLESCYSKITLFDENHFLLEQNSKKGLYSKTYEKIILPVQYDTISPFNNYITIATLSGVKDKYDVKGNKWS